MDMRSAKEISPSGDWSFGFYLEFEDTDWTIAQKDIFEILVGLQQGKDYQLLTPKNYVAPYQITLRLNNSSKASQIREYFKKNCSLGNVIPVSSKKYVNIEILAEDGFDINQLIQGIKDGFKMYVGNGNVRKKDGSKGFAKILIRN